MSTFGIIASEHGSSDSYYVGQDEVLWDWLESDNYQPSDRESCYSVQAPAGYAFSNEGMLVELNAEDVKNDEDTEEYANVTVGSPYNDKVLIMLEALQYLDRKNFNDCDIPEDRIIEILIY